MGIKGKKRYASTAALDGCRSRDDAVPPQFIHNLAPDRIPRLIIFSARQFQAAGIQIAFAVLKFFTSAPRDASYGSDCEGAKC